MQNHNPDLVGGLLSEADFKAFFFGNPCGFYNEATPRFFEGTAVEAKLQGASLARAAE